jgi:Cu/Ag efflux protein CusF
MKTLLATLSVLAILGWAGFASADTASGTIDSVNMEDRTITIDEVTYTLDEGVAMEDFAEGQQVSVTFEERDGENVVTEIETTE